MTDETTWSAAWARSGGAWLTGRADGPPLGGGEGVAASLQAALTSFRDLATTLDGAPELPQLGTALLGWRAAAWGQGRNGSTSGGGACRLLETGDGWVAVNLPRVDDWEMLPAWLAVEIDVGDWDAVRQALAGRESDELVAGGAMLGLPIATVTTPKEAMTDDQAQARGQSWPPAPYLVTSLDNPQTATMPPQRNDAPSVVDLSSLWAGPLCAQLLHLAGADVTKVESSTRPDGARSGPPEFFDALHDGVQDRSVDLHTPEGPDRLRALVQEADIVIEGSRPRALDQLGCGPHDVLSAGRRQVWISITGYGRTGPQAQWAALGDDAGVAGGWRSGHRISRCSARTPWPTH